MGLRRRIGPNSYGNGNVEAVLNNQQQVAAAYRYDPFGVLLAQTGSLTQPYGFSTKRYDPQIGMVQYEYRNYFPAIGRWGTRDPLGEAGGMNLYAFVGNNPVNWVDPWGLDPIYSYGFYDCDRATGQCTFNHELYQLHLKLRRIRLEFQEVQQATESAIDLVSRFNPACPISSSAGGTGAAKGLLKLAKKLGLNLKSPTTQQLFDNLNMPVKDFIAKYRMGSILDVFPGEFLDVTIKEALVNGGSTVRKLLTNTRFFK